MTWFSRKKEFPEEADILGDDFETEFDAIADAFNGLFKADRVAASENWAISEIALSDVPGATLSITPSVASLLLVMAVVSGQATATTTIIEAVVDVDGADQAAKIKFTSPLSEQVSDSQVFCIALAAGAHTVKLQAKSNFPAVGVAPYTGFVYLLIPDPEP